MESVNIYFQVFSTPCITDNRTVSYCKKRYKSVYRYIDTALVQTASRVIMESESVTRGKTTIEQKTISKKTSAMNLSEMCI